MVAAADEQEFAAEEDMEETLPCCCQLVCALPFISVFEQHFNVTRFLFRQTTS